MKRIKITFITGHLCKERHALLNELALDLGEYGADVTVITGFPSRRISEEVRQYYLSHPVEKISENVIVKRVGSKKGEGKGLLSRLIKYFFLTKKIYKEAKKTETDVYYLYSSPFFLGYIGKKLKKIAPTVYNAQDLFPDTLIHQKHLSERNLLVRYFRKKESLVYKNNSHIITISQEMRLNIISHGAKEKDVSVIYNWADTEHLSHVPKATNKYFDEFGIDREKFVISYAGDLGLFQGWDTILMAAKELNNKYPDILFVLIGSGSYRENILKMISEQKLSNIIVLPLQPANRLSEVYSIGDIELLPIEKGLTKMALPSKNAVIMATGNPILAIVDDNSDIKKIIETNKIGLAVHPGNVEELVSKIIICFENKPNLIKWGENAREYALANLSRKQQTHKYFECLSSQTNNNS